jgi:hypothetical protein
MVRINTFPSKEKNTGRVAKNQSGKPTKARAFSARPLIYRIQEKAGTCAVSAEN